MFIQLYFAEIMHGMHSDGVPTLMVAVLKTLETMITANMYGLHSTSIAHRFRKLQVVVKHKKQSFCMKSMH